MFKYARMNIFTSMPHVLQVTEGRPGLGRAVKVGFWKLSALLGSLVQGFSMVIL